MSIYADKVALFIRPSVQDLIAVREALRVFGEALGLKINYRKSEAILIRGDGMDEQRVVELLQCAMGSFPCRYLGINLVIRRIKCADWMPFLDQVRKITPAWQQGLIERSGRLILAKTVISARPIHQLLVLNAPDWVLEEIDKCMRAFFWAGKDNVNGGQCLVAWDTICRPTIYGGLGIKNLH